MLDKIYSHFARRYVIYLWCAVAYIAFSRHFILYVNVTYSLPETLYLVQKGVKPHKGNLVAFRYGGEGLYKRGELFLKQVVGTHGSEVVAHDLGNGFREYFVDGKSVGRAKPYTKTGMPLQVGPTGIIPSGHYYVTAPNPDSLDSRYSLIGWVSDEQLVGRAIAIF